MSQSRRWCFTLNNYSEEEVSSLSSLQGDKLTYLLFSKEVAPTTGTPHLQGYLETKKKITLKGLSQLIPRASLSVAKGTAKQNYEYITKSSPVSLELGETIDKKWAEARQKGADLEAEKWKEINEWLKTGKAAQVEAKYPKEWSVYKLDRRALYPAPETTSYRHYWLWGPPGTGKTEAAFVYAASKGWRLYRKGAHRWWDGYEDQEVVLMDDLDRDNNSLLRELKMMGDHRKFSCEFKGGLKEIRPQVIFVTSNSHPREVFPGASTLDLEALYRRYEIHEFVNVRSDKSFEGFSEVPQAFVDYLSKQEGAEAAERPLLPAPPAGRQKPCVEQSPEGAEGLESVLANDGEEKEDAEGGESASRKRVRQE